MVTRLKAFGINQYGNAHILQELQLPIPKINANEVLIKTNAFAINAFDIAVRNGQFRKRVTLLFPLVLGSDAVGRIVKIGRNVKNYKIGDDVLAHPGQGTYAEYFKVSTDHLGLLPNCDNPYEAAGLPLSGITAYNVLVHQAQVQAGKTIAILGAAGGVGSILVQMAKALGLYVVATDVENTRQHVLALGADEFGGYDTEHVREKFKQMADIVIDATNGGAGGKAGIEIIKDNGVYVSLTTLPEQYTSRPSVTFKQMLPNPKYLDSDAFFAISLMIRSHQLQVPIGKLKPFTLAGIVAAQKLVESNSVDGKVIIKL
ncbi:oxidoreductase [Loigolactobacillus bifermentans DSM 20003]|uniref:Oxidoreductase n=1 Tax=Loigolactobacillus bifermentans DSM 20003 TaxID=1423726 RepID=A0A0R1HBC1_9LACO|nr:oxidoreductase [Loigolactobacillus bifermentans DSM 20003]